MAAFKTHLSVSCLASGLTATGLLLTGMGSPPKVFLYFMMGIIGGILPDIDADNSVPIRLAFDFLAPVIAFPVIFSQSAGRSVAELLLIWLAAFFTVKYFVFYLFIHLTAHRGIIHSVPAGVFSWLLTTILLHRIFLFSNFAAWMGGFFVFLGFIIHLILDELNSFDLSEMRVKKSLGTALKLGSFKDPVATSLIYLAIIGLFLLSPNAESFFTAMLDKNHYLDIPFLPREHWFQELHRGFAEWISK